jgi:hypothetical protein
MGVPMAMAGEIHSTPKKIDRELFGEGNPFG